MKGRCLIACEFSGVVRDAFSNAGWDAWSCDLLPTERLGNHIQDDVLKHLEGWDLMIAHPPCTYLANSGVQHLHKDATRWAKMEDAARFFLALLNAPVLKVAVENPLPHHYAGLPRYQQKIDPSEHGHFVLKRTCLWLKNLPPLMATGLTDGGERYIGKNGKSNGSKWYQVLTMGPNRWKERSKTFQGIANAMAAQWG